MMRAHRFPTPLLTVACLAAVCISLPASLAAQEWQWPDEPENLEVLPEDIGADGLRDVMQSFTDALGVRCSHCHEGEGNNLADYDFASDEKEEKKAARVMMRMVNAINGEHLEELEAVEGGGEDEAGAGHAEGEVRVTCVTCHRGAEEPRMIQDVIGEIVHEEGVEAAVQRYRELRERFYGGFTYDFRPGPLAELGRRLAAEGRLEDGIRVTELEAEYHPDAFTTRFVLAQLQQQAGRTDEAVANMEKALELAPERAKGFLRRQLEQMRGGG